MIDASSIPTSYAVSGTQSYRFNVTTAATYFINAWDGLAPEKTWTNKGTSLEASQLPVPPAPAPDVSVIIGANVGGNGGRDGLAGANKCTFLTGGLPTSEVYTQTVDVVLGTGGSKRTYTYTYTYVAAPIGPVEPFTAWDLQSSNVAGSAHVDVEALIAGESVSVSKNNGTKYSYSLLQGDGTIRISSVGVSVDDGAPDYSGIVTYYDRNPAGPTPSFNFLYTGNAGINGTAVSSLINGDALAILNGDSFAGNNNGGSNGQALAAVGLSGLGVDLTPGDHTITITATVKDNSGVLVSNVTLKKTVHVITPGCGGGN